jgi:hypothetical protein
VEQTADPHVLIEERREGYVRYRQDNGRRWEVHGVCDRRGDCLIGAVINDVQVRDHEHLAEMVRECGNARLDSELDVPVTPEFTGCCPFRFHELER